MSYMPREGIFKDGDSIYKVTLLAAKRAIELNSGAKKLIETDSKKFSTIALEEIIQGKVKYKLREKTQD
ncbi:MAG: DNA-directed RNA polymerase subunit omega [Candidatus Omnitrophota bacterium]